MRGSLVFVFLVTTTAASAAMPDSDTACATLYTYLGQSARQNGVSGLYFDTAALKAEEAHLALNPTEDRQRYTLQVIDGAATIRDGLARGVITTETLVSSATSCNAHYFPDMQAQARDWSDDPQQAR
jgi:hypothetical protein